MQFSPEDPREDVPTPLCQAKDKDSAVTDFKVGSFQRKVYDVFTFLDELDSLEIRLRTLAPVVDKFVLIMCEKSFMNNTVEVRAAAKFHQFPRFHLSFQWISSKGILREIQGAAPDSRAGGDIMRIDNVREKLHGNTVEVSGSEIVALFDFA